MRKVMRWDKGLNVDVEIIDDQHKILFDLANDLNNAVNMGASKQIVNTLFAVILSYSFKHFETEENFIKTEKEFLGHCYQHYQLLRQLHEYAVEFRNNRSCEVEPGEFLEKWLVKHIKEQDVPLLTKKNKEITFPIDRFDDFDSSEIDRRRHKRIRYDKVLDEDIIGHCYNANTMKTGTVTVVDLASGGLKIYTEQKIDVDDLLVISCRVGKNFLMKEKVKVRNSKNNFHGVKFLSPAQETVQFLTQLCGAVHKY